MLAVVAFFALIVIGIIAIFYKTVSGESIFGNAASHDRDPVVYTYPTAHTDNLPDPKKGRRICVILNIVCLVICVLAVLFLNITMYYGGYLILILIWLYIEEHIILLSPLPIIGFIIGAAKSRKNRWTYICCVSAALWVLVIIPLTVFIYYKCFPDHIPYF